MKKTIIIGVIAALSIGAFPFMSNAQTGSSSIEALQAQISGLLAQIQSLRSQVDSVRKQASDVRKDIKNIDNDDDGDDDKDEIKLSRSLFRGLSGDDVKQLQEWLASDTSVYPEGQITGYFGPATERAIKRFQQKNGIEQAGVVGPKTRAQLEKMFSKLEKKLVKLGADTAPLDAAFAQIMASTTFVQGHKTVICHKGTNTLTVAVASLKGHVGHGDTIGACTGGGTSTTTPDRTAPVIFGINAVPSTTGAAVSWQTNESSDSTVWYATSTPVVGASGGAKVANASLTTSHTINLNSLMTSTTYYYLVVSKDASGNTATSTVGAFTTGTVSSDVTAPLIYNVSTIPAVNSASVMWTTNENANSRVWFAKTSDVMNDSTRATVSDNALVTAHNATLTGLTQGTTYYFLLVSGDASGNIATSSSNLYFFTTANLSISGVSSTGVSSTTATVNWNTNAASDSTVWYSTSSPVMSASDKTSVSSASSVTNHSLGLSALATSTLYHYVVVSKDAFGNSATSSESTFTTLAN